MGGLRQVRASAKERQRTVTGMAEYINREAVIEALCSNCYASGYLDLNTRMEKCQYKSGNYGGCQEYEDFIALPAADVREVVLCGECYLHTHCRTEDVFDFAGLREDNRFCSVGKRKTNIAKMGGAEDG